MLAHSHFFSKRFRSFSLRTHFDPRFCVATRREDTRICTMGKKEDKKAAKKAAKEAAAASAAAVGVEEINEKKSSKKDKKCPAEDASEVRNGFPLIVFTASEEERLRKVQERLQHALVKGRIRASRRRLSMLMPSSQFSLPPSFKNNTPPARPAVLRRPQEAPRHGAGGSGSRRRRDHDGP